MSKKARDAAVVVKDDPNKPVPVELLADAIRRIGQAAELMLASGLTRDAIVLLVWDACVNVPKSSIRAVLDVLPELAERYTTKKGGR